MDSSLQFWIVNVKHFKFFIIFRNLINNSWFNFGKLVWEAFINRHEEWSFGHYSINNIPIKVYLISKFKYEKIFSYDLATQYIE